MSADNTRLDGEQPVAPKSAMDRWDETHRHRGGTVMSDRPTVRVWCPQSAPWANLQTVTVGCGEDRQEALPKGLILANLHLAGVEIGGPLDELELLIEAASEVLAMVRRRADELDQEARHGA